MSLGNRRSYPLPRSWRQSYCDSNHSHLSLCLRDIHDAAEIEGYVLTVQLRAAIVKGALKTVLSR